MPLPDTKEGFEAIGWILDNEARCRYCDEQIEWWITRDGKKIPISVIDEKDTSKAFPQPILRTIRRAHFSDCPNYPRKQTSSPAKDSRGTGSAGRGKDLFS